MSIIYILIPLAIIIVALAIGIFFWAVKSNQFEDLERHGYSILFDDDIKSDSTKKPQTSQPQDATEQKSRSKDKETQSDNEQP
jgi:cbb3-type cytochrome oxidase maturation protein